MRTDSWRLLSYISIGLSALGFLYSLAKLLNAIDQVRKDEYDCYSKKVLHMLKMQPVQISGRGRTGAQREDPVEPFDFNLSP